MATFIVLASFSDQNIKNIKKIDRALMAAKVARRSRTASALPVRLLSQDRRHDRRQCWHGDNAQRSPRPATLKPAGERYPRISTTIGLDRGAVSFSVLCCNGSCRCTRALCGAVLETWHHKQHLERTPRAPAAQDGWG